MSYWIRAVNPLQFGALGLLSLSWAVGGWLIVTHAFAVKTRERLLTGIAAGFVLFLTLSNLLARLLPLPAAFSVAAGLILLAGILLGLSTRGRRAFVDTGDLQAWPQLLFLSGITTVFTLILRGLAIFDDYLHLPLVSIMGAGDIPPHFYLNPAVSFSYHYALQVFAACLERMGGFYPWSSWDVSRAFAFAFTLVLGWLWLRRLTGSSLGAVLGSLLLGFGGGARWLLLFLPTSWLTRMAAGLQLQASAIAAGGSLTADLISPFATQGGGPYPFPFAYTNAIYDPLNMVLGGTGALPALTVVLLLLMARPRFSPVGVAVYSLILADLALSGENVYAVLLGGVVLAAAMTLLTRGRGARASLRRESWSWAGVLVISLALSLMQGAFLTDAASGLLGRLTGSAAAAPANVYGFSLRWPPALLSGHLGPLSLLSPGQLVILLAELGPVLLLGPGVTWYSLRRRRGLHWLWLGLSYGALVSFVVPIFVRYGVDRSITRLPATAVWIWSLLGFVLVWRWLARARAWARWASGFGYAIAVFGGFVLFAVQLMAIQTPTLSYFIRALDGQVARIYWNRLEPNVQILDAVPERAVTIFGRASRAYSDIYTPLPDWKELVANPEPAAVHHAGYSYIYLDRRWWASLTTEQQQALERSCVKPIERRASPDGDFRALLDVRGCN